MAQKEVDGRELGFDTKAVTLGYRASESNNYSIVMPIGLSTCFEQDDPATNRGHLYTRQSNPTRQQLEKGLALLEDSKHGLCYSSGMGAISAVVQLLNTGDHVVSAEVIFGGSIRYFDQIAARMGISTTYVDATDLQNVERAIQPNTKLVFLESPTNPLCTVVDIAKIADIAHKKNNDVLVAVDNTFLTSFFQKPLKLGADISVYSMTKYLNGHTDVCMGATCFDRDDLLPRLRYLQNNGGITPSPFDCYLAFRGLKTLAVRMRQHEKNGLEVAKFLESHPLVSKVLHPFLPSHPEHELAKRQSSGHSGMIAFYVKADLEKTSKILKSFRVINLSASLGGVESLAMIPAVCSHASVSEETRKRLGITDNLIRLSIGLEDAKDLIADLDRALRIALR